MFLNISYRMEGEYIMKFNYKMIETKKENNVFRITLNRPDTHNALEKQMLDELELAILEADQNNEIKAITIQGAGDKAFASGANINQLRDKKPLEALVPGMQELYKKIENCSKVTIAVVNGFALGGGCELALASDIRIVTNTAKLGFPELNLGIIPSAGGTQRLSRIIGKGRALDMILTGKIINGDESERIGLASYVVNVNELEDKIQEVIKKTLEKGPIATYLAKKAIHKGFDLDQDAAMWIEKLSQTVIFGTEDKQEGTTAFLEKRKAEFKNK